MIGSTETNGGKRDVTERFSYWEGVDSPGLQTVSTFHLVNAEYQIDYDGDKFKGKRLVRSTTFLCATTTPASELPGPAAVVRNISTRSLSLVGARLLNFAMPKHMPAL